MTPSNITLLISLLLGLIAVLIFLDSQRAMGEPSHGTWTDGEDIDNLAKGCLGPIMAIGFAFGAILLLVLGVIFKFLKN